MPPDYEFKVDWPRLVRAVCETHPDLVRSALAEPENGPARLQLYHLICPAARVEALLAAGTTSARIDWARARAYRLVDDYIASYPAVALLGQLVA